MVIHFGTNRKRVYDLLLVRHSNLVLSCTFRRYCKFLCSWSHPYSTLFLRCSCWTRSAMLGVRLNRCL